MPDKIPFECKRCRTRWERKTAELDIPDMEIQKGFQPQRTTYRDACPACGTLTVVDVTVTGGRDA